MAISLGHVGAGQFATLFHPGVIAHESARRGGERLTIPDMGEPDAG